MKYTRTRQIYVGTSIRHSLLVTFATVGFLLALIPTTSTATFDTPSVDALRGDVIGALCERVSYDGCPTGDGSSSGDNGGETGGAGGSGGTEGSAGGTSGASGGGTVPKGMVRLTLRTQAQIVVSEERVLPRVGSPDVLVRPTTGGDAVPVPAQSALALLLALDEASDTFTITDLVYYPAYSAFFLNCIEVSGEGALCGAWQFAVNGTFPSVGLDAYELASGDRMHLFFGAQHTMDAPHDVYVGEPFQATVLAYNPERGVYLPARGFTVGLLVENPDDPWSPIERAVQEVGSDGSATFTVMTVGSYFLGIKEDGYYPTVPLEVHRRGGGGMFEQKAATTTFDVDAARGFLLSAMYADGSFGAPLYTDWVAVALAASGASSGDLARVRDYLLAHPMASHFATDHERRALALMALGVDPYDESYPNYVDAVRAYFDGTQVGDPTHINDDIFGLIVFERGGVGETIIDRTRAFILTKQQSNGSWEGSIDLTAAAVQALAPFRTDDRTVTALKHAEAYLRAAQRSDGGFGDGFATSWVLQAIAALGQDPAAWRSGTATPFSYLASLQERDGGMLTMSSASTTRLWATAYAIPGMLGKPWQSILVRYATSSEQQKVPLVGTIGARHATSGSKAVGRVATASYITPTSVRATSTPVVQAVVALTATQTVAAPVATGTEAATVLYATSISSVARVLALSLLLIFAGTIGVAVTKRVRAL